MRSFEDTALYCIALHCTTVHCTALQYSTLYCTAFHYTALYCTALQFTVLDFTALPYTALRCTLLNFTKLDCTALYCTQLHCIGCEGDNYGNGLSTTLRKWIELCATHSILYSVKCILNKILVFEGEYASFNNPCHLGCTNDSVLVVLVQMHNAQQFHQMHNTYATGVQCSCKVQ